MSKPSNKRVMRLINKNYLKVVIRFKEERE
ncbi:hypothetical protein METH109765_18750 [Mesobacillus thioparans]